MSNVKRSVRGTLLAHLERSQRRAELHTIGLTDDDIGHISRVMGGAKEVPPGRHEAVLEAAKLGTHPYDIPAHVWEAEKLARSSTWDGTVLDAIFAIARVAVLADVPHAYANSLVADISRLAHGGTRP